MAGKKTIGELSVLLGMDTEVFEKKMGKSKSDLESLSSTAQSMALKFAAAFAAVAGAVKSAEVVIQATQFTADAFDKTVAGLKQGMDNFFIAVSSGDWTNFIEGLNKSIEAAKNLASEMDALGDVRRGLSIQAVELEGKQFELLEKMKDKTGKYSIDQQKKYFEEYTKNQKLYNGLILDAANRERDAILDSYSAITGLENVQIYQVLKNYGDRYEKKFNEAQTKLTKAADQWGQTHDIAKEGNFFDKVNFENYLSTLSDVDKFYVQLYRHFGKLNDAKLDTATASIRQVGEALNANSKFAVENMRLYNMLFKGEKGDTTEPSTVSVTSTFTPSGKFGSMMNSELQKQLGTLTDPTLAQRVANNFKAMSAGVTPELEQMKMDIMAFSQSVNDSFEQLIEGSITTFAAGIGEAFATGDWSNFGKDMLNALGQWAQQFGSLLIASGVALKALYTADPFTKIIAGGALVAIGAALSAVSQSPPSGSGSTYSSNTSVSPYSNSNNSNRVIQLEWKRAGRDLVAIMKDENTSFNTLTGKR